MLNKHLVIGTAGHVDHGKTALIKALTDIDCDTHKEEKERGITINLGFSHIELPNGLSCGIIDVPGHKDFIKTMVAGAFGIDIFLLLVAADSGVMPQTKEHLDIIKVLGIKYGVVAISKADLVDEDLLELVGEEVEELLVKNGFQHIPMINVSSFTGRGLHELISALGDVSNNIPEKKPETFFRMYIDRIFNVKGFGHVVTGTVLNGKLLKGSEVYLLPGNKKYRIKNIERHGQPAEMVEVGDRAALNISGLKMQDFSRGMILSDQILVVTSMIDATLRLFDVPAVLSVWSNVIFLSGTFECIARVHLLDKDHLEANDKGLVQIQLDKPLIMVKKDRFIIRNTSNTLTLGGGTVFDTQPLHHRKRTKKLVDTLTSVADATLNADHMLGLIRLELVKNKGIALLDQLLRKLNLELAELEDEMKEDASGELKIVKTDQVDYIITLKFESELRKKISAVIKNWHEDNSLLMDGMNLREIAHAVNIEDKALYSYLDLLLNDMEKQGLLEKRKLCWIQKGMKISIDRQTKDRIDLVEKLILNTGIEVISLDDIVSATNQYKLSKKQLLMILKYLEGLGRIFHYQGDYLHQQHFSNASDKILDELSGKEKGMNEKELRLLVNSTKRTAKLIVAILKQHGLVYQESFYVHITTDGRNKINK